jgi:hypothetical protein
MPYKGTKYLIDDEGRIYTPLSGGERWQRTNERNSAVHSLLQTVMIEAAKKNLLVRPAASNVTGQALYFDPRYDPRPERDRWLPILAPPETPKRKGCASAGFLAFILLAALIVGIILILKLTGGSTTPSNVMASPLSKYKIKVTWVNNLKHATGFHLDNGCPAGACGGHGATVAKTTGRVTSTIFRVTPGAYECFRVQALSKTTTTGWSSYGCTSTPSLNVYATQAWTRTHVILKSGDRLFIKANGQLSVGSSSLVFPSGKPSCTPTGNHSPNASNYPAPHLPCLSLIGRIGNNRPFEVGDSVSLITRHGRLYLGVNGSTFSGSSGSWTVNIKIGGAPPSP